MKITINNKRSHKAKGGEMLKVIVAGSRTLDNYEYVRDSLNEYLANRLPDVQIVSGTAKGADKLGERYAKNKRLSVKRFAAEWDRYGKSAGYRRNEQMAAYADCLIAFWDKRSRGTKHMIEIAEKSNLIVSITLEDFSSTLEDRGPIPKMGKEMIENTCIRWCN